MVPRRETGGASGGSAGGGSGGAKAAKKPSGHGPSDEDSTKGSGHAAGTAKKTKPSYAVCTLNSHSSAFHFNLAISFLFLLRTSYNLHFKVLLLSNGNLHYRIYWRLEIRQSIGTSDHLSIRLLVRIIKPSKRSQLL